MPKPNSPAPSARQHRRRRRHAVASAVGAQLTIAVLCAALAVAPASATHAVDVWEPAPPPVAATRAIAATHAVDVWEPAPPPVAATRTAAAGNSPHGYRWPVAAAVVDPFRPPATPYGRGNRGLEFGTGPGVTVGAAASGVVVFAGQVAGRRYVTIRHADGVRTSYGGLATVLVGRGDVVAGGEAIAVTGGNLHVGARIGSVYVDPALLFGVRRGVRLVAARLAR